MKGDVNVIPISITVIPLKMTIKKTIQIQTTNRVKNKKANRYGWLILNTTL